MGQPLTRVQSRALPRPHVREVHSDHEGQLVSELFRAFCAAELVRSPLCVHTMHNVADFFTKAFEAKKFHAMRRIVMNDPERL